MKKITIALAICCACLLLILIMQNIPATNNTNERETYSASYSDDDITEMLQEKFDQDMKSSYYSSAGTAILYHGTTVDEALIEHDKYTNEYHCVLNVTYSTNIFDFYGTSNTSYVINAIVYDTGSKLIIKEFRYS